MNLISMPYTLAIFSVLLVLFGLYYLVTRAWLKGFLIGSAGVGAIILSGLLAIVSYEALDYQYVNPGDPIGTLSFSQDAEKIYSVTMIFTDGNETNFPLQGSHWEVHSRLLDWSDLWSLAEPVNGVQVSEIKGLEYQAVSIQGESDLSGASELAKTIDPMTLPMSEISAYSFDDYQGKGWSLWPKFSGESIFSSLFAAGKEQASQRLLMVDGALFSLSFTGQGLEAKPLNDRALLVFESDSDSNENDSDKEKPEE